MKKTKFTEADCLYPALADCRTWVQKLSLQTVISVLRLFEDVRAAAHHSCPVWCIVCLSGLPGSTALFNSRLYPAYDPSSQLQVM